MCIRDSPGDVLVRNTTRVIPARIFGHRPETGGTMEFLLLKRLDAHHWECLVRPGRRAKPGPVSYTHLDVYKRQMQGRS